jgi:3-oxoacyl-[acyl-carrier protein] reductase
MYVFDSLLKDKFAVITGASKGIGYSIADTFASHGCSLLLLSRNIEKLNTIKLELEKKHGVNIYAVAADVSDFQQVKKAFLEVKEKQSSIDILVNNAGIMDVGVIHTVNEEQLVRIFKNNVYSSFYCTQFAVKAMIKKRKGSIINISSIMGTKGNSGMSVYGSSKAAIIGQTLALSKELATLNIRVNALAPGFIETDMTKNMDEVTCQKYISFIGFKKFGKPKDVANAALYLASDLSEYITGQIISIDGGLIL